MVEEVVQSPQVGTSTQQEQGSPQEQPHVELRPEVSPPPPSSSKTKRKTKKARRGMKPAVEHVHGTDGSPPRHSTPTAGATYSPQVGAGLHGALLSPEDNDWLVDDD